MSTRNFWGLVVKSKLPPRSGSSLEAVESHPLKGAIKFKKKKNGENTICGMQSLKYFLLDPFLNTQSHMFIFHIQIRG